MKAHKTRKIIISTGIMDIATDQVIYVWNRSQNGRLSFTDGRVTTVQSIIVDNTTDLGVY